MQLGIPIYTYIYTSDYQQHFVQICEEVVDSPIFVCNSQMETLDYKPCTCDCLMFGQGPQILTKPHILLV